MATKFTHFKGEYRPKGLATDLNTVDIWSNPDGVPERTLWVVFIHGGAWRDPNTTADDFIPALEVLLASPFINSIAGFASINYRLSSYSKHPTKPSHPDDPSRNAVHPDHVNDVAEALHYLEEVHKISKGYLLVGHSAGATIAFQIMAQQKTLSVPEPKGILGVEGIYDLAQLVESFKDVPYYREFVVNSFGEDPTLWARASPTSMWKSANWLYFPVIMIAHSDDDQLVDRLQADLMLEQIRGLPDWKRTPFFFLATGNHDEIISQGHELARLVEAAMKQINL